MGFTVFLNSVFAPGAAALLTALLLLRWATPDSRVARRAGAGIFVAGLAAGYELSFGGLPWELASASDWPIWGAIGAGWLAILLPAHCADQPRARLLVLTLAFAAGIGGYQYAMYEPLTRYWEGNERLLYAALVAGAAGIAAATTSFAASRRAPAILAPALVAWAGLSSGVLMASASARSAHTMGIAAATLGAIMLISWKVRDRAWFQGVAFPFVGILALVSGFHFGFGDEVDGRPLLLLAAPGPLLALWTWLGGSARKPWVDFLVCFLLTTLPAAAAWAWLELAAPADPYGGYYGG